VTWIEASKRYLADGKKTWSLPLKDYYSEVKYYLNESEDSKKIFT